VAKENPDVAFKNFSLTQYPAQIKVYPNPVVRVLTVDLTNGMEAGLVRIEIINIIGEQLTSWELNGKDYYELDMTGFPNGIYILKIFDGKQIINHKLIKQ
jgi:hypothetical protein